MELPDDIRKFVETRFPLRHQGEALSILGQACIEDGTPANPRLLRCAVFASRGNLSELRTFASLLAVDWRDVVMAGEYELRNKVPVQVRDLNQPLQV